MNCNLCQHGFVCKYIPEVKRLKAKIETEVDELNSKLQNLPVALVYRCKYFEE